MRHADEAKIRFEKEEHERRHGEWMMRCETSEIRRLHEPLTRRERWQHAALMAVTLGWPVIVVAALPGSDRWYGWIVWLAKVAACVAWPAFYAMILVRRSQPATNQVLIIGDVGSGKSTLAMRMLDTVPQGRFISNVTIEASRFTGVEVVEKIADMKDYTCGGLFIDDLSIEANSRDYKFFPQSMMRKLVNHRKDDIPLCVYTAQRAYMVDKNFRQFCQQVWVMQVPVTVPHLAAFLPDTHRKPVPCPHRKSRHCDCLPGSEGDAPGAGTVFWYRKYRPEDVLRDENGGTAEPPKPIGFGLCLFSSSLAGQLRTEQKAGRSKENQKDAE